MSTNPLLYKIDAVPSPVTQTVNVKMTMTNGFQSVSITSNPEILSPHTLHLSFLTESHYKEDFKKCYTFQGVWS